MDRLTVEAHSTIRLSNPHKPNCGRDRFGALKRLWSLPSADTAAPGRAATAVVETPGPEAAEFGSRAVVA